MPRGVAHPSELRAEVVAAVIAGMSIIEAARHYNLDKSVVSRWVSTDATITRARDPETLVDLIVDLIAQHAITVQAQLQAVSRTEWLERQSAADLAALLGAERDTLLRLLAGLQRVEPDPGPAALGAPETPGDADG